MLEDFFELRKCDDEATTTEPDHTAWPDTTTHTDSWGSATSTYTTNPDRTSTLVPPEPDYDQFIPYDSFAAISMINSSYEFEYSHTEISYDLNYD